VRETNEKQMRMNAKFVAKVVWLHRQLKVQAQCNAFRILVLQHWSQENRKLKHHLVRTRNGETK